MARSEPETESSALKDSDPAGQGAANRAGKSWEPGVSPPARGRSEGVWDQEWGEDGSRRVCFATFAITHCCDCSTAIF